MLRIGDGVWRCAWLVIAALGSGESSGAQQPRPQPPHETSAHTQTPTRATQHASTRYLMHPSGLTSRWMCRETFCLSAYWRPPLQRHVLAAVISAAWFQTIQYNTRYAAASRPAQHFLYFFPEPQWHGPLGTIFCGRPSVGRPSNCGEFAGACGSSGGGSSSGSSMMAGAVAWAYRGEGGRWPGHIAGKG